MKILALGQARSKFRLKIQFLKVPLPPYKENKKFEKTPTLVVRHPIPISFLQMCFAGEEKYLWKRNEGETQAQNSGLWRTRLCLLSAPWTVLNAAFRCTSPACSAYSIIGKFTTRGTFFFFKHFYFLAAGHVGS